MISISTTIPSCPREGDIYLNGSGLNVLVNGSWQQINFSYQQSDGIFIGKSFFTEHELNELRDHVSRTKTLHDFIYNSDIKTDFHREFHAWLASKKIIGYDNG